MAMDRHSCADISPPSMAASSAHSSIAMATSGFNDPSDARYRANLIQWKDCDGRRPDDAGNAVGLTGNVTLC